MKRLGPELKVPRKLSDVKAPDFATNLYCDLRDRRLLPLVALLVVTIVAVPFLLGNDSETVPVSQPSPTSEGVDGRADGGSLVVVEANPGLRDYRKRLKGRTPTDPFAQTAGASGGGGSGGGNGGGGGGAGSAGESRGSGSGDAGSAAATGPSGGDEPDSGNGTSPGSSGSAPPSDSPSGGGSDGGDGSGKAPPLITFVIDVQISRSEETARGGRKMGEPKLRRRVRPFTQLPGKKAPVVTAMGANLRTAKIMFLVSDEARSLDGEFECATRTPAGICELLEVEPGFVFEVVHGPNRVRYRFKVTKVAAARAGRVGDSRGSRAGFQWPYRALR